MRQLTMRFGTYALGKFEKATGKGVMDLLDIGNLEVNKIATIIRLGNPGMDDIESAYQKLDDYLASDEEHSIISAFFDLIDEMDHDLKILKSCGVSVKSIKEQFQSEVNRKMDSTGLTDNAKIAEIVNIAEVAPEAE